MTRLAILLATVAFLATTAPANAAQLLKQSTATTVTLGPFLDDTDGATPETALSLTSNTMVLSKNGGAFAQKNTATTSTHDTVGWYRVALDTTDTGTLGRLVVMCDVSGALPVWQNFTVIPANEFDSFVSGTDALDVEVASMATDSVSAEAIAVGAIGMSEFATSAVTEIWAASTAPTSSTLASAVWASVTRTLTALGTGIITADSIAANAITSSEIAADAIGASEIAADASTEIWVASTAPTSATIATSVLSNAVPGSYSAGSVGYILGTNLDATVSSGGQGAGAISFTYTLTSGGSPVADADIWVSTDNASANVIASGQTDQNGQVTFWLDTGTVYVWRQKSGTNFTNPDTETVP